MNMISKKKKKGKGKLRHHEAESAETKIVKLSHKDFK